MVQEPSQAGDAGERDPVGSEPLSRSSRSHRRSGPDSLGLGNSPSKADECAACLALPRSTVYARRRPAPTRWTARPGHLDGGAATHVLGLLGRAGPARRSPVRATQGPGPAAPRARRSSGAHSANRCMRLLRREGLLAARSMSGGRSRSHEPIDGTSHPPGCPPSAGVRMSTIGLDPGRRLGAEIPMSANSLASWNGSSGWPQVGAVVWLRWPRSAAAGTWSSTRGRPGRLRSVRPARRSAWKRRRHWGPLVPLHAHFTGAIWPGSGSPTVRRSWEPEHQRLC